LRIAIIPCNLRIDCGIELNHYWGAYGWSPRKNKNGKNKHDLGILQISQKPYPFFVMKATIGEARLVICPVINRQPFLANCQRLAILLVKSVFLTA
jgi:hypothetical protein